MIDLVLSFFVGFGAGLVISLMLGTVFFALLNDGLLFGYKAGLYIGLGVIITDIIFILAAFAFTEITATFIKSNTQTIRLLSGGLIILLGLLGYKKFKNNANNGVAMRLYPIKLVLKGALLNGTNPVNFFAWLSLQSFLITKGTPQGHFWIFFIGCIFAILITEIGIAYLAKKVFSTLISDRKDAILKSISFSINTLFVIIGITIIVYTFLASQ